MDLIFICIIAAIWAFLPTDWLAGLASYISREIQQVTVNLPYSRQLETEADYIGLLMAGKACFDVRESSAFWQRMSFLKQIHHPVIGNEPPEFLSTHPSHESRHEYVDSIMPEAISVRNMCNCPLLPKQDPREFFEKTKEILRREAEKKIGVLSITPPAKI